MYKKNKNVLVLIFQDTQRFFMKMKATFTYFCRSFLKNLDIFLGFLMRYSISNLFVRAKVRFFTVYTERKTFYLHDSTGAELVRMR